MSLAVAPQPLQAESKRATRHRLQQISFSEKVKLLEKLRERSLAIARSPLRTNRRMEG